MKFLLASSLMLMMMSAQASYVQESCTNADSSARWALGHGENGAFLRTTDSRGQWFIEEFELNQLNISVSNKKSLGKKNEGGEGWSSTQSWYTGSVVITPKPEAETKFKKVFPTGRLEDRVICTKVYSGEYYL